MSRLVNHLFRGGAYVALAVRHRSPVGRDLRVHRKRAGVQRRAVEECHGSHPALRLVSLLDEQGGCARGAGGLRREPARGEQDYKAIEEGAGGYKDMSPADRQKLLADVKLIDQNTSVTLTVPSTAKPGQEIQITANLRGGHGVVGVWLMESDLRL